MSLSDAERSWYYDQIERRDPRRRVVAVDRLHNVLIYDDSIQCDETRQRPATNEEVVRALALCILTSNEYKYEEGSLYIEKYYKHGHPSSKRDEVDLIIFDQDRLPFAMWDFKSAEEYDKDPDKYIQYQLFGTAPLVGGPKLLAYGTIRPRGKTPSLTVICIDRTKYQSYESWVQNGRPHSNKFPQSYIDLAYEPLVQGSTLDLRFDCTQADFRAAAATFHAEFFSEHPDNVLFANLLKCLLAKIYDERQTKTGESYGFQVFYKGDKEETAAEVFARINHLYRIAYIRYIESSPTEVDEINRNEFSPERLKTVVKVLQGMSLTRGAALHADVIGAFFEEILRTGFKQDKGMYFTHANLVWCMLECIDLDGLAVQTWKEANHPDNRLPYIIDPACGSGSFLLRAMYIISNAIRSRRDQLATDFESMQFFDARMSDMMPHYWAEHFVYGMDPKFVMAVAAKINMVLHGDGSVHIFKYDALKPFPSYSDDKLKPISDPQRAIPRGRYPHDVVETFDVVVSNPPFGISLSSDTRATLHATFSTRSSMPSEGFFLERWFQLLKPNGRLAVVVPESLLNAADTIAGRILLYRTFWIRAIVALPRNLFIETPTLTSLLFAQKKTADEIAVWDHAWDKALAKCAARIDKIGAFLKANKSNKAVTPEAVQHTVVTQLSPILSTTTQVTARGKPPVTVALPSQVTTGRAACLHYIELIRSSGFSQIVRNFEFAEVCNKLDYEYPVYMVDEVGYKLSKRKERIRPNQLFKVVDSRNKRETPNLHLADGPIELVVDPGTPDRILDYIRRDVKWR